MAPVAATRRLFLVSVAASIVHGQADLEIDVKPQLLLGNIAAWATWTQQTSDFDSLYCVVFEDPDEAVEDASNSQVILIAQRVTGQMEKPATEEPEDHFSETTPAPISDAETKSGSGTLEEVQARTAKCQELLDTVACAAEDDCEWHPSSSPVEAGDPADPAVGECNLNAVVALKLLGDSSRKPAVLPTDSHQLGDPPDDEELSAPVRRTEQESMQTVEHLRRAAALPPPQPRRRLENMPDNLCAASTEDECTAQDCKWDEDAGKCAVTLGTAGAAAAELGKGAANSGESTESTAPADSVVAAVAEGKPLKPCLPSLRSESMSRLPHPCVDPADFHRANFLLQGTLVPGQTYIAFCATSTGASAHKIFSLETSEVDKQPTEPTLRSDNATAQPVNGSANSSNTTGRTPKAAGGTTLETAGKDAATSDDLASGGFGISTVSVGAVVVVTVILCTFYSRRQSARGSNLFSQDLEMLSPGHRNGGSYVGPGDLSQTFSHLKDGPE